LLTSDKGFPAKCSLPEKQNLSHRQGLLNGPATTFFTTGQVDHEFSYSSGKVDGTYQAYSDEAKLLTEDIFSNRQLQ